MRVEPALDQPFLFQVADEGADSVAADALAIADFRGIEFGTAVELLAFVEIHEQAEARIG